MTTYLKSSLFLFCCLINNSCALYFGDASKPLTFIEESTNSPDHKTLLIFLPGMGDKANNFIRHGFFKTVRQYKYPVNLLAVDAHFAYYRNETLVQRLHQEIILPARNQGYTNIWLIGISLGGMGALLYSKDHPTELNGIILLAPYLGDDEIISQIEKAGGVSAWSLQQKQKYLSDDYQVQIWQWLALYYVSSASLPRMYLVYGDQDKLSAGHHLLSQQLKKEQTLMIHGKHHWRTWSMLWALLLKNDAVQQSLFIQ